MSRESPPDPLLCSATCTRSDREVEEFCELLDGEEAVVVFHVRIIEENPVARVS